MKQKGGGNVSVDTYQSISKILNKYIFGEVAICGAKNIFH